MQLLISSPLRNNHCLFNLVFFLLDVFFSFPFSAGAEFCSNRFPIIEVTEARKHFLMTIFMHFSPAKIGKSKLLLNIYLLATSMGFYSDSFPPNILLANLQAYREVERIL